MKANLILQLINLGVAAAQAVPEAVAAAAKVRQMVEEGRDPTPEEVAALAAVTADLHERVQRA